MGADLERSVSEFKLEALACAPSGVEAIVLYGSAASPAFVPGRSDLNFLVVLERIEPAVLDAFQKRMKGWARKRIAAPLVVNRRFLASSTDSYPLEILGMMAAYRVIHGIDPFQDLQPEARDVRLQAEREAKAKGLLLRSIQIESCGKESVLRGALAAAVPALDAILRGVLFIQGTEWRELGDGLRRRGAEAAGIDAAVPLELASLRRGESRPSRDGVVRLYGRTLGVFDELSEEIDNLAK